MKEIDRHTCKECDSSYRLVFDLDDTNGHPRFCPFCGCDTYDDDKIVIVDEEEE